MVARFRADGWVRPLISIQYAEIGYLVLPILNDYIYKLVEMNSFWNGKLIFKNSACERAEEKNLR